MKTIHIDSIGVVPEEWMLNIPEISILKDNKKSLVFPMEEIKYKVEKQILENRDIYSDYINTITTAEMLYSMMDEYGLYNNKQLEELIFELYSNASQNKAIINLQNTLISDYFYSYDEYLEKINTKDYQEIRNIFSIINREVRDLKEEITENEEISEEKKERYQQLNTYVENATEKFLTLNFSSDDYNRIVTEWKESIDRTIFFDRQKFLVHYHPELFDEENELIPWYESSDEQYPEMTKIQETKTWKQSNDDFKNRFNQMIQYFKENNKEKKM